MAIKIPETKKNQAIALLVEGRTYREIANAIHASDNTVRQWERECYDQIQRRKKEIRDAVVDEHAERLKRLAKKLLSVAEMAVDKLTEAKVAIGSGPQIATTAAIMIDKMQLITGGATETVDLRFKNKEDIVDFLRQNESAKKEQGQNITPGSTEKIPEKGLK